MISGEERENFLNVLFNFFNEGQNGPFNKLLGAPAILLGAPSISQKCFARTPVGKETLFDHFN